MNATSAAQLQDTTSLSTNEDFAAMFEESIRSGEGREGSVQKGVIVVIENDFAIVDVGLKSEGRIALREFGADASELKVGDEVEVYVDRYENNSGEAVLSREKALREKAWSVLEEKHKKNEHVEGVIFGKVKGGFIVDLQGAIAFLPGSQVDVRPVRDVDPLIGIAQPFAILKMDRKRSNIVVSRRAILEESRMESRNEILAGIREGQQIDGIVKNITDYGAFIDLGGVDGLLHVTDISWRRIGHPSEVLKLGETIKVVVTKYNPETKRVSLGMKQLEANPWQNIESRFPIGARLKGKVTNITDYGAFVELEPGIEGLVHVSEMSWTKKNIHPGKIVSTSEEVEVMVLGIDPEKHRISLGIKQCQDNPWKKYADEHKAGEVVEGEVRNVTDFGLFLGLNSEIDGLIHSSDLSWSEAGEVAIKNYKKGDVIKAVILGLDVEKERISLGVKQLSKAPEDSSKDFGKGKVVTCTVKEVQDDGIGVEIEGGVTGFIKRSDLSRDRAEQRPDRFAVGDRIDAKVQGKGKKANSLLLSIKALEIEEENRAIKEYGSTDSGASLGDILGAALSQAKAAKAGKAEAAEGDAPKKAKAAPKKAKAADDEEKPAAKKSSKKKADDAQE
ncbi:MAG: 30S ribosomal protein S1 [Alphaproteobacteria bacterium]|nr:30S ribosomal protein S1 [Alphaproteobacteria bacterium]